MSKNFEVVKVVCHRCGHIWYTKSERRIINCPSCYRPVKNPRFHRIPKDKVKQIVKIFQPVLQAFGEVSGQLAEIGIGYESVWDPETGIFIIKLKEEKP